MIKKTLTLILILPFFIFTSLRAELIKPNSNIEPYKVVKIQLTNNQRVTVPLESFKIMLKCDSYKMLLNHLDHKIVAVKIINGVADYEVTVLDIEKKYYKFNWRVEKYILDGELKDCWLTTMVSQPIPLGSSI